jgi:hypothetical protein
MTSFLIIIDVVFGLGTKVLNNCAIVKEFNDCDRIRFAALTSFDSADICPIDMCQW